MEGVKNQEGTKQKCLRQEDQFAISVKSNI